MITFNAHPFIFTIGKSRYSPEYNLKISQVIDGIVTNPYDILSYNRKFYVAAYMCNKNLISALSSSNILDMRIEENIRIFTLSKLGYQLM